MDKETILTQLYTFNDEELFYKDYYLNKQSHETFSEYLKNIDMDEVNRLSLYLPEILEDKVPDNLQESFLFQLDQKNNIALRKHNRYTPAFFHNHDFFEIIYILSGNCVHTVQSEVSVLKAGDLCMLAPCATHSLETDDDHSIIINIAIRSSTFHDIFFHLLQDRSIISDFFLSSLYSKTPLNCLLFMTESNLEIRDTLLQMYSEYQKTDEYSDRILSSQLTILFSRLIRNYKKTAKISDVHYTDTDHYFRILNYIHENYKTVTLSSLSAHLNYSAPYCSKLVRQLFSQTFSQLLMSIRMKRAKFFLETSNLSIASISTELGYENPEHFMRLFKKTSGMTPSEYRDTISASCTL